LLINQRKQTSSTCGTHVRYEKGSQNISRKLHLEGHLHLDGRMINILNQIFKKWAVNMWTVHLSQWRTLVNTTLVTFRELLVQSVTNTSFILVLERVRVTLDGVLDWRLDLLTTYKS
jgi:hypothetical protein